jgi:hypothetical protein
MTEIFTGVLLSQPTKGILDDGTYTAYALFQKDHTFLERLYGAAREAPRDLRAFNLAAEQLLRCNINDHIRIEGASLGHSKIAAYRVGKIDV